MKDFPPNYVTVFRRRQKVFLECKDSPQLQRGAIEFYSTRPADFINDWGITYDPRNALNQKRNRPTTMPFILFDKQIELVDFIMDCLRNNENGLIEKTRDMGATWTCAGISVWLWRFHPGASVGWGSRKEALVDKLGDPDSIFEKIRMIIRYLPPWLTPLGYDEQRNASFMRIINPENGSTITGEAGDNIGRGGRKLIYFKDESAHYERPERIEAALSENTDVQIDISSVNGSGNIFYRRRMAGIEWEKNKVIEPGNTRVFVMDWRDHPLKSQHWYNLKEQKAKDEGLLHIFRQEVDRDYSASQDGIVIPRIWVLEAVNAHEKLGIEPTGQIYSALDVADGGKDKNAIAIRKGIVLIDSEDWGDIDAGKAAEKAVIKMNFFGAKLLFYDSIGVGAGVKAATNMMKRQDFSSVQGMSFIPWNAAATPLFKSQRIIKGDKNTPTNGDFFSNLKAQAWWNLRLRFERTYDALKNGTVYPDDQLISLDPRLNDILTISRELSQAVYHTNGQGKIVIDKTPEGTRSPNKADAIVMSYWPLRERKVAI